MGPTISFICPWELSFQSRTIMNLLLMTGIFLHPIFLFLYVLSNLPNSSFTGMLLLSSVTYSLSPQVYALQILQVGDITSSTNRHSLMWHRGRRLEIISPRIFARVASSLIIQGETLLKYLEGGKEQKLPLQQQ